MALPIKHYSNLENTVTAIGLAKAFITYYNYRTASIYTDAFW